MATVTIEYSADHVRDYNTTAISPTEQQITANERVPARLLTNDTQVTDDPITGSGVINDPSEVTDYRFTFEVDGDGEVITGSTIGIEYSLDGGSTWSNFYDDTDLAESGYTEYYAYIDEGVNDADGPSEWIAIQSTNPSTGLSTAFMLSEDPIAVGDTFTTDDPATGTTATDFLASQTNEFLGICFTRGMKIETERGEIAVEDLEIGDMVRTFDNGYQPVRFIKSNRVAAKGKARPVLFKKGAIGNSEDFMVSQRHRMYTRAHFFARGYMDHLVEAIEYVNGRDVVLVQDMETVEYFHIMLDRHELLFSHGTVSESWQPHARNLRRDKALREELLAIFPDIMNIGNTIGLETVRPAITTKSTLAQREMERKIRRKRAQALAAN